MFTDNWTPREILFWAVAAAFAAATFWIPYSGSVAFSVILLLNFWSECIDKSIEMDGEEFDEEEEEEDGTG